MNNLTLPEAIEIPQQDALTQFISRIGSGFEQAAPAVLQQLLLQPQQKAKQQAQVDRGNALARALLAGSGVEDASTNTLDEPADKTDYQEVSSLTPEDVLRIAQINATKERGAISREKSALADTRKFRDEIREGATSAQRLSNSVKKQRKLLESGLKTGPLTWDSLMFRIGMRGAASPEAQAFQANLVDYMEGMRAKFGVRLTDADLKLVLDKIPDIARSREGNDLLLSLFESQADFELLKKKALKNSMKKGVTLDLEDRYNEELEGLLQKNQEIENKFENSLNKLHERATGRKVEAKAPTIGQEFKSLPAASEFTGVTLEDEKGNRFISNGKTWRKI